MQRKGSCLQKGWHKKRVGADWQQQAQAQARSSKAVSATAADKTESENSHVEKAIYKEV